MPLAIPRGLTRAHVLLALAELDAGPVLAFGKPTKYELVHDGKRYAPKAAVGLACRHLTGHDLSPQEFSGGEAPGQANHILRQLGFTVVRKGEAVPGDEPNWTEAEVALVVADYFDMLRKELFGEKYVKKHRNARLRSRPELSGRTTGSVEYKHQNISAVLVGLGLPYIRGYKPAANFQGLLAQQVKTFLDENPTHLDQLEATPDLTPALAPPVTDPDAVFEERPEFIPVPPPGKPWLSRKGRRTDFARRDAENRRLGELGEMFVVELERARLRRERRDDLAGAVRWATRDFGDGLGYDVLSFDESDDSEQLVEVKTTGHGKYHSFYVTATEVRCSEDVPAKFRLYRVFEFAREPRVFVLPGALTASCRLEPVQYRAAIDQDESAAEQGRYG
jgi:hypothetical protein